MTALESGIVDGFAFPSNSVVKPGFARAIKFKLDPPWWVAADIALVNAKAFDALPADIRKLMIDTMVAVERDTPAYFLGKEKEEDAALLAMGVKTIDLPASEITRIQKIHWEQGTKLFLLDSSPKFGKELVELMKKFAPK